VVRRGHLIAVVGTFLIGCAVLLLVVGCAGTSSETSKKEQGSSPQATDSEEEARCEGTRTLHSYGIVYRNGRMAFRTGSEEDMKKADKKAGQSVKAGGTFTTNDLPGCPKGGLLLGTDSRDWLDGKEGDDEIRGLGGNDALGGGPGSDILYGGEGDDFLDSDYRDEGDSEDVFYGGDGNDQLITEGGPRAKLYCGEGRDEYAADKDDYVDSSCEKTVRLGHPA
jgi:RTX calcium-binding nonapeptide repeat (4 copies)